MPLGELRIVLDTNTLFRGLAKPDSASGKVISAIEDRRAILLTSRRVIDEYRTILLDQMIVGRYESLSRKMVEASIRKLSYFADHLEIVRARFEFPRDPRDEKFLALAVAGKATHLVTFDNDLLSMVTSHSDAAKRLRQRRPRLRIMLPSDFLNELENFS